MRTGFQREPLTISTDEAARPLPLDFATEYALQLNLVARYRVDNVSGPEGRRHAREIAVAMIRSTLYADLLLLQSQLMHAISDGDKDAALGLCMKLRQEIVG